KRPWEPAAGCLRVPVASPSQARTGHAERGETRARQSPDSPGAPGRFEGLEIGIRQDYRRRPHPGRRLAPGTVPWATSPGTPRRPSRSGRWASCVNSLVGWSTSPPPPPPSSRGADGAVYARCTGSISRTRPTPYALEPAVAHEVRPGATGDPDRGALAPAGAVRRAGPTATPPAPIPGRTPCARERREVDFHLTWVGGRCMAIRPPTFVSGPGAGHGRGRLRARKLAKALRIRGAFFVFSTGCRMGFMSGTYG